jgi:EAL domain-containing protein (putative c-di-GMP-specific phosphodiesterase class I)
VVDGRILHLAACIGTAVGPQDGADPVTLLRNGQSALHAARAAGPGHVVAYRPAMSRAQLDDLALEERLRGAIGRGELSLHYQPQISLQTGRIIGAEALLRWQHPELGAVPPGRFIPIAEETGLIHDLGAWVLDEACRHWRGWQAQFGTPPPVAVNLAAPQFQRPGFARGVVDLLAANTMPSAALQLEITESMVMGDVEAAIAVMRDLTRAGIDLAIDDFGTGYSSLSHLQRFPVAKLKIDRSFVLHCDRQPGDAAIVAAVIAMARSMNLRVIAEGVETEGQRAVLRDLGCDEMQGYLFSRPLPADQYAALLISSSPAR